MSESEPPTEDLVLAGVPLRRRKRRPKRLRAARPPQLTIRQILAWADDHQARTGRWPKKHSGPVRANRNETWHGIHGALQQGCRGLPGSTTLAKVLAEHRGVRNVGDLPRLTIKQILAWADFECEQTGRWPTSMDHQVLADTEEKWQNVAASLSAGGRGLPGGTSLAKVLAEHRGVRNRGDLPPLTERQILAWADAWHRRTGQWPRTDSRQEVPEAPGERWNCIDQALRGGSRGLPGGDTLGQLLARERGVRNIQDLPRLTEKEILRWCKAHHRRTGAWPTIHSGAVEDARDESWHAINSALRDGGRGLPGGSSLAQLMAGRLGLRNKASIPSLATGQILEWADSHKRRTGQWPRVQSGRLADAPDETWLAIDSALREGLRGLPGGDSLPRLLARRRGARNKAASPPLTEAMILRWADCHHRRIGKWPTQTSGPVLTARGETWGAIERSLSAGLRGLPGGDSLARLFARRRAVRSRASAPRLTEATILEWATEHYRRTGSWPNQNSGQLQQVPSETWGAIQRSLLAGQRGLPGGDSIVKLLTRHGLVAR
jgi:hypothetical protein